MTTTLTALTTAALNQDIATADAATSGSFVIDLQGNITETADLDAINLQSGVTLTIDGSNGSGGSYTLDGAGTFTGLLVDAGSSVTIENLDLSNSVSTLASGTLSGTVTISNNATIDQTAPVTFGDTSGPATIINEAGSVYDIAAVVDIAAGPVGTSQFINEGTLEQTSLEQTGASGISHVYVDVIDTGTLSVVDRDSNLEFDGPNNSFSGTYVGGGMIDYGGDSTDALGTIDMTEGACTTNYGTVNQSGVLTLSTLTTLTNVGGTWNFTTDDGLVLADPGQINNAAFFNYGTLAKSGGTGTTVIGCDLTNHGPISVASGTLAFNGPSNNFLLGAISGAGTFSLGGGGADEIDSGVSINSNGWTITDAGTDVTMNEALSYSGTFIEQSGATLTLSNNLTLNGPASFANAIVNGSGILATYGTTSIAGLTLASGAQWQNFGAATVDSGGTLSVANITGSGSVTIDSGSTLTVLGTTGNSQTIAFAAGNAVLEIGALSKFDAAIQSFTPKDILRIDGTAGINAAVPVYDSTDNTTSLILKESGSPVGSLTLVGNYGADSFTVTKDPNVSGAYDVAFCFMPGTMILTPQGEVAVEMIKRGDLILSAAGTPMPTTWIGRQTISTRFGDPLRVLPIRIKAEALEKNIPSRDLLLSPDHAILVGEILIQASALVNGISIIRENNVSKTFTYYHVEVDDHSLILAENTAAETFIDNVDRLLFDNWQEHEALYPEGKAIAEMPLPRAKSYRQVPRAIRERLIERAVALYGDKTAAVA